jgi:uncharacterized protein (DUF2267 family)
MTSTTISSFDHTYELTNTWLKELAERMGGGWDRRRAYHALRAVLHALRDRLPVGEAVDLGAQLPMLVRGFYYEGWRPANTPLKDRSLEHFVAHVATAFPDEAPADVEEVTRAVFELLAHHVTGGEIEDVKAALPREIKSLWE